MRGTSERILTAILAEPWLIEPGWLERILLIAQREIDDPQLVALRQGRDLDSTRTVEMRGSTAVIPVRGPIFRYANLFTEISGATSLEVLAKDFGAALDDRSVEHIVLSMDSPGGQATGIAEFASLIWEASKPVTAYVGDMAASAAYWIAAAADRIVASPTAMLGSIGVVGTYRPERDAPIKIISTQSPLKQADPSTEAGRAEMQRVIDELADVFIDTVAGYRGASRDQVLADFGRGGLLVGAKAVSAGMADEIGSLESLIAGISGTTMETYMSNKDGTQATEMTRQRLAATHPELLHQIEEDAKTEGYELGLDEGYEVGLKEGRKEGAQTERERISAVRAQSMPGHEALIDQLAFDGVTTAEQAAVEVLAAEKERISKIRSDVLEDGMVALPAMDTPAGAAAEPADTEAATKAKWDADPALRSEFRDNFERYRSFLAAQASGRVRVLHK